MLIKSFTTALATTLALSFALIAPAAFAGKAADTVNVTDAHVRAMPPGIPNSAMFFTLQNSDSLPHRLVKADSDIAKRVELHTHIMEDGMARMREVDSIDVDANDITTLMPGGLHVMLFGLTHDLVEGEKIAATLHFADGSSKTVNGTVMRITSNMHHHHDHGDHDHHH